MADVAEKNVVPPMNNEEKKEKKSKKEKKEAEPEPEFYIPEEERKAAYEEMKHLFDLSIKKKSKKHSGSKKGGMGVEGDGKNSNGIETNSIESHPHMSAETFGDEYHKYVDVLMVWM